MTRKLIFDVIEHDDSGSMLSRAYDCLMVVAITVSIIPLMFRSEPVLFVWFERITVSVFIIDYLLRWITADFRGNRNWTAFVLYPITPIAVVDMLSILPGVNILGKGFKVLRLSRLLKILRVMRFVRYSNHISMLVRVLCKERKTLLSVLMIAVFYIFVTALIMFNSETSFNDFFDALYWATTTLTTVGYGDIYPTTDIGRIISMLSAVFGVAIIALPSGIVTASYLEEMRKDKK